VTCRPILIAQQTKKTKMWTTSFQKNFLYLNLGFSNQFVGHASGVVGQKRRQNRKLPFYNMHCRVFRQNSDKQLQIVAEEILSTQNFNCDPELWEGV